MRYAIFQTSSAASEGEQRHRAESQGQRDKRGGKRIKKIRKEVKTAFHKCYKLQCNSSTKKGGIINGTEETINGGSGGGDLRRVHSVCYTL